MNVSDDASRYSDLAYKISKAFGNSKGGEHCRTAVTPTRKIPTPSVCNLLSKGMINGDAHKR